MVEVYCPKEEVLVGECRQLVGMLKETAIVGNRWDATNI